MRWAFASAVCGIVGAAVAVAGCGASAVIDPVARAASATLSTQGYKMSAVMNVTGAAAPVTATMRGQIDAADNSGTMTLNETIGSQPITAPMIYSQLNFWVRSSAITGAASRIGGKKWIYVDMSKVLGAMGVGSLPATINPGQFLSYLSSVQAQPTKVGTLSIHGVATTEYRAVVNLDHYAQQNSISAQSISGLERSMGSHSMPVEAWIDANRRVRRVQVSFPECVEGKKLQFSMTMGIYGFGPQPQVQKPARADVFNLTPKLASATRGLRLGC